MNLSEKAGYIKGLIEGLDIDRETKEGKILCAMSELMQLMANTIDDLRDDVEDLNEDLDDLDGFLERVLLDGQDEEDGGSGDDGEASYEVDCPNCGKTVYVSEADLEEREAFCPSCGKSFGIELEEEDGGEDEDKSAGGKYEYNCPNCGAVNVVDVEDVMGEAKLQCASCGKPLFPWEDEEDSGGED